MTAIPIIEQDAVETVKLKAENIEPATKADNRGVGLSFTKLTQEASRRAAHIKKIQAYVNGSVPTPPERVEPNAL